MNKGLIFLGGLLVGASGATAVAHFILKPAYEQKAEEEINACRDMYLELSRELREKASKANAETNKEEAKEAMKTYGAAPEKAETTIEKADKPNDIRRPYIIESDVFNAPDNPHDLVGLTYYTDGVICGDNHFPLTLEELDDMVGRDVLTKFGDDGPDAIYVRNDKKGVDYEIVQSVQSYAKFLKENPHIRKK